MAEAGEEFENALNRVELVKVMPRLGQKVGWVYFIACRATGHCKIGYTTGEVEKRIKALQTGSPGKLTLVVKQPGTIDTERELHERFGADRIHGEWFAMSADLFAYICAAIFAAGMIHYRKGWRPEQWLFDGFDLLVEMFGELPAELQTLVPEFAE